MVVFISKRKFLIFTAILSFMFSNCFSLKINETAESLTNSLTRIHTEHNSTIHKLEESLTNSLTRTHTEHKKLAESLINSLTRTHIEHKSSQKEIKILQRKVNRYLELAFVVDHDEYNYRGKNLSYINERCKEITKVVNSVFEPFSLIVVLVGVEIWSQHDEISFSDDEDQILKKFLLYRRDKLSKNIPNDFAVLITRKGFKSGTVGKALKGAICSREYSGAITFADSNSDETVASFGIVVAHLLGHSLGIEHDTEICECPDRFCIMNSRNATNVSAWSSCSVETVKKSFERQLDYCMRNIPTPFDAPTCGNGIVEEGEDCDCGGRTDDCHKCCRCNSCKLKSGAECAEGDCCDLANCKFHQNNAICRVSVGVCDLLEFCSGTSGYCPEDRYVTNGTPCNATEEEGYCYKGTCPSRNEQCRVLWGKTGKNSHNKCYQLNTKGTRFGNCGFNQTDSSYVRCSEGDVQCGRLHCKYLAEELQVGIESLALLSHIFIAHQGDILHCRIANIDLGYWDGDPGLVPDGVPCGDKKMCLNQKCVQIDLLN